jgi:hypothetical protein
MLRLCIYLVWSYLVCGRQRKHLIMYPKDVIQGPLCIRAWRALFFDTANLFRGALGPHRLCLHHPGNLED